MPSPPLRDSVAFVALAEPVLRNGTPIVVWPGVPVSVLSRVPDDWKKTCGFPSETGSAMKSLSVRMLNVPELVSWKSLPAASDTGTRPCRRPADQVVVPLAVQV